VERCGARNSKVEGSFPFSVVAKKLGKKLLWFLLLLLYERGQLWLF